MAFIYYVEYGVVAFIQTLFIGLENESGEAFFQPKTPYLNRKPKQQGTRN